MIPRHHPNPSDLLPLKPLAYLALLVLVDGPLHGYALVKAIARRTDDVVRPGPASIHRTLRELREAELIEPSPERPSPALDDARRLYFRITAFGRAVMRAETDRLQALVTEARETLGHVG
ncbi:MAG TPA: helix-turn-helix transcriptional regulator [Vicinamibacterales bacterium]|nr:helix-turn-helix transcriptional regulator [Vicinamibacterales bacterium]